MFIHTAQVRTCSFLPFLSRAAPMRTLGRFLVRTALTLPDRLVGFHRLVKTIQSEPVLTMVRTVFKESAAAIDNILSRTTLRPTPSTLQLCESQPPPSLRAVPVRREGLKTLCSSAFSRTVHTTADTDSTQFLNICKRSLIFICRRCSLSWLPLCFAALRVPFSGRAALISPARKQRSCDL
jgi:hypothetical protein